MHHLDPVTPHATYKITHAVCQAAVLQRLLTMLAASLLTVLAGCSGGSDNRRGYDSGSGDLGAFILRMAPQYGVRFLTTNGLAAIPAKWQFKRGSNVFNLVVEGDSFPQLNAFLSKAVGPPSGTPTTNPPEETSGITAYYGTNFGVTVSCGRERDADGKQLTGFVIVNYGAVSQGAGTLSAATYAKISQQVISEALKNPLKEFECHDQVVEHAADSLTFPREVEALFGATNVDHYIEDFTGEAMWNSAAYFAGRYTLNLRVPIAIDYERCRVKEVRGPAEVWIREVTKVEFSRSGAPGASLDGNWTLNENDWKSLVKNGGNWAVINVPILSNAPVKDFDKFASSVRDPIRYRKENYDRPIRETFEWLRKRGANTNTTPNSEKKNP